MFKRIASLVGIAAFATLLCGCGLLEPKVTSPVTGKPATGAEIVQQLNQEAEKERKQAELDLAAKAAEIRRAQAEATNAATEIKAQAQITGIEAEKTIAQLGVDSGARIEQATADIAAIRKRLDDRINALQTQGDAALAEVERQRQQNAGLLKFAANFPGAQAIAASAGINFNEIIPYLVGSPVVGGVLLSARNNRKRTENKHAQELAAIKAAHEEKIKTHNKAWDGAKADGLTEALMAHVLKQAGVLPASSPTAPTTTPTVP